MKVSDGRAYLHLKVRGQNVSRSEDTVPHGSQVGGKLRIILVPFLVYQQPTFFYQLGLKSLRVFTEQPLLPHVTTIVTAVPA